MTVPRFDDRCAIAIIWVCLDSLPDGRTLSRLANSLPEDVCRFVERHIHTLEQLEILRLLVEHPARPWSASELARELRTNANSVHSRLLLLQAAGLTAPDSSAPPIYRYHPESERVDEQVRTLLHYYQERRVAVISQIYAPAAGAAHAFAEAFRIKKGDG